uniref:Protein Vpw n=1 Tax=Bovine immunodeficiency virus (strain R29) TaxID=417296 RepID=VPW_BIV29|nr:RecName: Full=Protein Vpw [Bovine immunodeficiency virus R29]
MGVREADRIQHDRVRKKREISPYLPVRDLEKSLDDRNRIYRSKSVYDPSWNTHH